MSESIKSLVDRGHEVHQKIVALQKELKAIEKKLKAAALNGDHQELKDAEREGRRYLARGSARIVPVVFTADKLVQSFQKFSAVYSRIEAVADGKLRSFYKPFEGFKIVYDDGKKFRAQADHILGDKAPPFITACLTRDRNGIPKSDIKVEWEEGESIEEAK